MMTCELSSAAGIVIVDDSGVIRFRRGDKTLLETTIAPVFAEYYGVNLALRAAGPTLSDGALVMRYVLPPNLTSWVASLALAIVPTDFGFRLTLDALPPLARAGINFAVRLSAPWYGLGERVVQSWPLDVTGVVSDPLIAYDHAHDGTLNIATPLLIAKSGAGLLLENGAGNCFVNLDSGDNGRVQLGVYAPEPPKGAGLDSVVERQGPRLVLNVILADDIVQANQQAIKMLGHPISTPPQAMWAKPIWTTWARYKMGVKQQDVLDFADEIIAHGYPYSIMEIDDRWQTFYGDLAFDSQKFPDPAAMVARLHEQGFKVTLWIPPFYDQRGAAFAEAAQKGFLLRDSVTGQPILTHWWEGVGGLLDMTNPAALAWWHAGLKRLQTEYGIDGFKFDGGEANFVPANVQSYQPFERRDYPDQYIGWVAKNFEWTEVRAGWRSQRNGILFRQWDKWSRWGLDNGLHSILTQALAMSVIGYPFVLPDMIGGNAYDGEAPDGELLVRWTQLSAVLPAMQFSIEPWRYGAEVDQLCQRWAQFHTELVPYLQSLFAQTVSDGTPIVRPLFWHHPDDAMVYTIDDQFLLGENLLVAPVVRPGATVRDVYLPAGQWRDRWSGHIYHGGQWLRNYPAPLEILPLFERQ